MAIKFRKLIQGLLFVSAMGFAASGGAMMVYQDNFSAAGKQGEHHGATAAVGIYFADNWTRPHRLALTGRGPIDLRRCAGAATLMPGHRLTASLAAETGSTNRRGSASDSGTVVANIQLLPEQPTDRHNKLSPG